MTDTLAGDALSRRIAKRLGDALAAPTVRSDCSGHHMECLGTITILASTLMELICAHCQSLNEHSFEYIVLVLTHGGNFAPTNTVAPEIARNIDAP
nr:creatininase family protein [Halocatena pleomorpha]